MRRDPKDFQEFFWGEAEEGARKGGPVGRAGGGGGGRGRAVSAAERGSPGCVSPVQEG